MSIRVAITHRTSYVFDRWVRATPHVVRLRPAPYTRTPILGYTQTIEPSEHFLNWQQDPFGNYAARLVFPEPIHRLVVAVEVIADMSPYNPFDYFLEPGAEEVPFEYPDELLGDLAPYREVTDDGPLLREMLASVDRRPKPTNDFLVELNQMVAATVAYEIRMEPGVYTAEQTLEKQSGSCRDSAWLLVQLLRHLGYAARFVSGYLVQLVADEPSLDGPSGPTQDFTDLHAWAEVYLPGAGWIGLDATSGLFASEGHIPLAATPHPRGAAPITGATEPCEVEFEFTNTVERIHETPRTTLPYRAADREAIVALGRVVDERLDENDVRLTVGGEPTFVSIDDRDGGEWTFDADGPTKRALSETLVFALRDRFAPGSLLHVGQGKWYPGEPLPRWAKRVYWRDDGVPVWERDDLIAPLDPEVPATRTSAKKLAKQLATRLGLPKRLMLHAYEDPIYHLWQEATIPPDVDPADLDPARADLDDIGHRRQLAHVLDQGLSKATGYVLPLTFAAGGWRSSPWQFRRGRLFLLPGSSALGLRLPLDRLPVAEPVVEAVAPADPLVERPPLAPVLDAPAAAPVDTSVVTTALCVEERDGVVYVFLPPIDDLAAYLSLVSVVHDTAASLEQPVRIEGYEPPGDPRLSSFAVTPDPGVIEVNIHPVQRWDDAVEVTTELYRIARECRLSAEKFDLDGRHTGTGGGNHITLGGPTAADSPMLRRPDLLRSLVTYWQHHPGLSYLFSGQFIGPTSQSPRVDEARHDTLDELEIAFEQLAQFQRDAREMPDGRGYTAPWTVDRLLRNLLADLTGNTHRAEFCIDKLYPPQPVTRRLGIVELRGFEMPPHAEMSLVQQLLLRSLLLRFWERPYEGPLVRWGTRLHDQFLLPHFVAADVADVCRELNEHGIGFRAEWLDPFVEFRFPQIGSVQIGGVTLELRRALEPWNVLGEEMSAQGASRSVDASLERLQVEISGATEDRHVVTCNGVALNLHPTGDGGRFVGGVRYKAWDPPFSLHPTIPVSSPLVFDLIDTWTGRSLGGCRYHVAHPGGRSYETFPVNANEAAGRRGNRFWEFGHTPPAERDRLWGDELLAGEIDASDHTSTFAELAPGPDAPSPILRAARGSAFTVDLRRAP
jgi:uncharacterized protein (DUF2126 family)/transglutaminase-like putative cysteine protease